MACSVGGGNSISGLATAAALLSADPGIRGAGAGTRLSTFAGSAVVAGAAAVGVGSFVDGSDMALS
jgi:threonine dehydratase